MTSELDSDERLAVEIQLGYYEYQRAHFIFGEPDSIETFERLQRSLQGLAPLGPVSALFRACKLFQLLVAGSMLGWLRDDVHRVEALLAEIPRALLASEEHFFICTWAYRQRDRELLLGSYEYLEQQARGHMLNYVRDRARLLLDLLDGKVDQELVLAYLQQEMPRSLLADFKRLIVPALEQRGQFTVAMKDAFEQQLSRVLARHTVPIDEQTAPAARASYLDSY